jgi:anti-anti-sigma factor
MSADATVGAVASLQSASFESKIRLYSTTVRASGRINSATSVDLARTLRGLIPRCRRIVLDLSTVNYIDNAGLSTLVNVYVQARVANCDIEIHNSRPRARDFARKWLHSVFEGHTDMLGMTPD